MAESKLFVIDKKQQIRAMFNRISLRYDFLNHFLSLGIDRYWRSQSVNHLREIKPSSVLDIATGTADFAICAERRLHPDKITGIDISEKMLALGRNKILKKNVSDCITLMPADSENLPFVDNTFDAITVGFGVRNFENLQAGLNEMVRVLKPGGRAVILEFSKPDKTPIKQLYAFYFKYLLPFFGRIISHDKIAYSYLHDSVIAFPEKDEFLKLMILAGFSETHCKPLSFGIASIYVGDKHRTIVDSD